MTYIPLQPIDNDPILVAAGFHRQTSTLRLTLTNGKTVDLPGVSEREVQRMMASEEIGKAYSQRIRLMFGARTVQPNEMQAPPPEEDQNGN